MKQTFSWGEKFRELLTVLVPIYITQVSLYAMSLFGTMMAGHAGADELAGVAIGVNVWMPLYTGLMGLLIAVTPLVAHLLGGRKTERIPFVVVQGMYLAVAIAGAVLVAGMLFADPLLRLMGLEPAVQDIARRYLIGVSFGIVPLFVFSVLRCFIDTLGYTRVTMGIFLASLPLNILLNYGLIFGKWGLPCLGGAGVGYASAITCWLIFLVAVVIALRVEPFARYRVFADLQALSLAAWREQLTIGIPIGFAIFCETSIFGVVAVLMVEYNTVTIAAHQAAMNFASLLYMVPLSISMALTIVVGYEVGAGRFRDAKQYGLLGLGTAVSVAGLFAVSLVAFNETVAGYYTRQPEVKELIGGFLVYAAFFQLSDAIATPIQGILRGYKDVNITLAVAVLSYWVIGLPSGYLLAHYFKLGAYGYWIGLIVGLAFGALFLSGRLLRVQRRAERGGIIPTL